MTEITQADQDAAVEWYSPRESEWTGLLAQAFARHREYGYHQGYYDGRTMTEAETVAKIAAWLESMIETAHDVTDIKAAYWFRRVRWGVEKEDWKQ